MNLLVPPCVDGSGDHHWDPMPPQGQKCRDCLLEILLVGDPGEPGRVVHIREHIEEERFQ